MNRVVLLSDTTPEFHNNTPDTFEVHLAEPMAFDGDWKVALTSLSIPDSGRTWGPEQEVIISGLLTLEDARQGPIPDRRHDQKQRIVRPNPHHEWGGSDVVHGTVEKEAFFRKRNREQPW